MNFKKTPRANLKYNFNTNLLHLSIKYIKRENKKLYDKYFHISLKY